jgi:Helix-turn-helix domain
MPESEVLEAAVRAVVAALTPRPSPAALQETSPGPMQTVAQTATLLGISRMTVIRKADGGALPCVVINRGTRQKMRRFPRAAIEQLAAGEIDNGQADLKDYTTRWLADVAGRRGPATAAAESARQVED